MCSELGPGETAVKKKKTMVSALGRLTAHQGDKQITLKPFLAGELHHRAQKMV